MAKTTFTWAKFWAIVSAVLGVAVAGLVVILSSNKLRNAIAIGLGRITGGIGTSSGSASAIKRDNSETINAIDASRKQSESVQSANSAAIKNLDDALDRLRRARSGFGG